MRHVSAFVLFATLVACDGRPDAGAGSSVSTDTVATFPAPADSSDDDRHAVPSGLLITSDGIGHVQRGMSVQDVRQALPSSHALGPAEASFMVDLLALPVSADGDTVLRLVFPAGAAVAEGARPHFVVSGHPLARTVEGVGPGTTLDAAARVYGAPTLSYSIHDESREYAAFPRQPEHVRFRVRPASDDAHFAGTYTTSDEYNTTSTYDPEARIWMVFVDLAERRPTP